MLALALLLATTVSQDQLARLDAVALYRIAYGHQGAVVIVPDAQPSLVQATVNVWRQGSPARANITPVVVRIKGRFVCPAARAVECQPEVTK